MKVERRERDSVKRGKEETLEGGGTEEGTGKERVYRKCSMREISCITYIALYIQVFPFLLFVSLFSTCRKGAKGGAKCR